MRERRENLKSDVEHRSSGQGGSVVDSSCSINNSHKEGSKTLQQRAKKKTTIKSWKEEKLEMNHVCR